MEPVKTLRITCVSIVHVLAISFIQSLNVLDFPILHFVNKRIVNKSWKLYIFLFVVLVSLELSGVKGLRLPPPEHCVSRRKLFQLITLLQPPLFLPEKKSN